MTRDDFLDVMGYISVAIGKPLGNNEKETARRLEVYFDLLGDLPLDVLRMASQRVCLDHQWPTFPSAAELRKAAAQTLRGVVSDLSPAEAWKLAWRSACSIDPSNMGVYQDKDGTLHNSRAEYVMKCLPPLVAEAVNGMGGLRMLANANGEFARQQFVKAYEGLLARENRAALLPPALKRQIEANGQPMVETLEQTFRSIGQMPD